MSDITFDQIEMAKIDKKAPVFSMDYYDAEKDTDGTITSQDLKGKWYVLFYYPADFTFVCPTELKDLADVKNELDAMKVEILPVSTDTVFTHKGWVKAEGLLKDFKYKMLADHNGEYADLYNVLDLETHLAWRWTFIIDPDGILRGLDITSGAQGRNSTELIRKLQGLQFMRENPNMACPAKWAPGSRTLIPGIDLVGKVKESL